MNVTRNVIADLLPLYEAGEASADTRALVESFLKADPTLLAASPVDQVLKAPPPPPVELERRRALERTVSLLKKRQIFFAMALCFTLMPLSFTFSSSTGITWLMWRDTPDAARAFVGGAIVCWAFFLRARNQLRATGL
ncbi:MAG TPA: hypothetical protein VJ691_06175 [Vicinamibacterales bacterium]|nr:hypothetical protein [Vicinamibacterales bacterium]